MTLLGLPRLHLLGSLLVALLSFCLKACDAAPTYAVIAQDADLKSFQEAAATAGLILTLNQANPSTLFAPTNAAFAAQATLMSKLVQPEWKAHLAALIKFHVVTGDAALPAASLTNGLVLKDTLYENSDNIKVSVSGDGVVSLSSKAFQDSKVIAADIAADNGVVHKVDKVFMPQFLTQNVYDVIQEIKGFSLALPFIVKAGLDEMLRGSEVTLFGPTTVSLADLPPEFINQAAGDRDMLRLLFENHIAKGVRPQERLTNGMQLTMLSGQTYTVTRDAGSNHILVGSAPIEHESILAGNGVAHRLSGVLLPPNVGTPPPPPAPPTPEPPAAGVALTIAQQDDLTKLEEIMRAVRLVTFLSSARRAYTVFAPTDTAWTMAAPAWLTTMLADPVEYKAHLVALVRYHVHAGSLPAVSITNGLSISNQLTLQPVESYTASVAGGTISINGPSFGAPSTVVETDLADATTATSGGLVHKVDRVFVPTALTRSVLEALQQTASLYPGFGRILPLITAAGLDETLRKEEITMFAPSNSALDLIRPEVLDELNANPDNLRQVLEHHMVSGNYYKDRLISGMELATLAGTKLRVRTSGRGRFKEYHVNAAYLEVTDILAANGLAHVIDVVLIPPTTDGFACTVCESGLVLTSPETEVNVPPGIVDGIDTASCALIDVVVNNSRGQFGEDVCSFLRGLYTAPCGCLAVTDEKSSGAFDSSPPDRRYLRAALSSGQ